MPRELQKTGAMILLVVVASTISLEWYCALNYELFLPFPSPVAREPGLYSPERTWSEHSPGSLQWAYRYHVGMGRDEVERSLEGVSYLVASATRPDRGWKAMWPDPHGLAYRAIGFERGHRDSRVNLCELYEGNNLTRLLFFDERGRLIGAEHASSFICLSAVAKPANSPAAGKAGIGSLFAIEHRCPSPPEPGCSAEI